MTLLNGADSIYLGTSVVDKVYLGSDLVFPTGPGLLVVTDDFNRANGALGANWHSLVTNGGLTIASDAVVAGGQNGHRGAFWADTFSDDQYSEVTIGSVAFGSGDFAGPMVRGQNNGDDFYTVFYFNVAADAATELYLYKRVGGGFAGAGGGFLMNGDQKINPTTLSEGDVLRLEARGNFFHVYVNGDMVMSAWDSDTPSGGSPGIFTYSATNLVAVDDFSGGEVSAATPGVNTTVTDNFNRADGPNFGDVWTWQPCWEPPANVAPNLTYAGPVYPSIVSNHLVSTDSSEFPNGAAYTFGTWGDDQASEIVVTNIAGGDGNHWAGATVRDDPLLDNNYLVIYFQNTATPELILFKTANNGTTTGQYTTIGSAYPVPGGFHAGDVVRLEAVGTALTVKLNGATVITGTDSTYTSGAPGIRIAREGVSIDSWTGETL